MTDFEHYFAALSRADAAAAVDVLDAAASRGVARRHLLREVVAPAQRKVGELWFDGTWSVADEHAATAVSDQAVSLLCPPASRATASLRVVLACAEGEWHTLPARLAAELSRSDDVDVVFLGASTPAAHLQRHLVATGADVLALSCTMTTNLIGAARSIDSAHAVDVPVVVGGHAWGRGDRRARRLGADLRLEDAESLAGAIAELEHVASSTVDLEHEALLLDVPPPEMMQLALERQTAAMAWMRSMTHFQRSKTLEDLVWLARHAAAAVACDDSSIVAEVLEWLLALLTPRGVPAVAVLDSCYYLADAVEPDAPLAAAVLRAEAHAAHSLVGS